jgi:regulator of replication initiation timing
VNTDASTATNMQYMHDIHSSLQAQIDKLASDQQSMQSTLTRLLTTDTLLLDELHGLKRKMDEKDSIFSAAFEQSKHQRTYHPLLQQQQQQQQNGKDGGLGKMGSYTHVSSFR